MGGLVTYKLTLENPNICQGAIMFAPALKSFAGTFMRGLGLCLGAVIPRVKTAKPNRAKNCKDPIAVQNLIDDPLMYNEGARTGSMKSLVEAMANLEDTFQDYNAKFIMFFGGKDMIVDPLCSFKLMRESKSPDKTLYHYENLYHDIWHEEEIFDIIPKLLDWLKKRRPENNYEEKEEKTSSLLIH